MSRASVIVSLLIAVGLTVVSIFTLRPSDAAARERQAVFELNPAGVTALSVAPPDGPSVRVERGRLPGQWLVRTDGPADERGAGGWPIAAERMRAALRVLAELRGRPSPGAALPEGAATLTIERDGAGPLVVRIASPALGGRRLVEVEADSGGAGGGVYEIEDWLHEAFVASGPRQWRDTSAMPGISADASRIAIISGPSRTTLGRAGGRWALTGPVGARADQQRVEGLIGRLGRLQVARFYDEAPPADITRLDQPIAQVRVERDIQIPAGADMRRATESITLTVGGPIDATNTALFARVTIDSTLEGAPRGEAIVSLSADDLNRINPIPNWYIAPQAVAQPASEIGGLALARPGADPGALLERTREAWELKAPGAEAGAEITGARARAITDTMRTFCEAPAAAIVIEPPQDYTPALTVTLQSLGGAPLEIIELGSVPAPPEAGVDRFFVIRTGEVYRAYESRALGGLELLVQLLDEVAPASEGPPPDEPAAEPTGDG